MHLVLADMYTVLAQVLLVSVLLGTVSVDDIMPARTDGVQLPSLSLRRQTTHDEEEGGGEEGDAASAAVDAATAVIDSKHPYITVINQLRADGNRTLLTHIGKLAYAHTDVSNVSEHTQRRSV